MDNTGRLLLLVVFGGAGLIAMLAAINLILPAQVERTRGALEGSLGRSFTLGVVNSLFAGIIAALFIWLAQRTGGGVAGGLLGLVRLGRSCIGRSCSSHRSGSFPGVLR